MKLEHLIQAYKFNKIKVEVQPVEDEKENAGVLKFTDDINASYLLDKEGIVIALNLFSNCVVENNKTMKNQIDHTTKTLIIIQKTIELLGNTKQTEANEILKHLGLFNGNIKAKAVCFTDHIYKIDTANGLLMFTIFEKSEEKRIQKRKKKKVKMKKPPIKSQGKKLLKESGGVA